METNLSQKDPELWRQARRQAKFKRHRDTYLMVNLALWLIWFFSGLSDDGNFRPYGFWPMFPTLLWAIGVAMDWFNTYSGVSGNLEEKEYLKLLKNVRNLANFRIMFIRHITVAAVLLWGIPPTLGAQSGCCPYINGILVLPSNPTTADSLTIVFTTTTPNQGIQHYFSASQSGSILHVEACFWNGLATALKTFSDTLRLPPQPAGPYQVHYTAFATEDPDQCVPSDTNFMSISFEVTAPNSGLLLDTEQALLQIFPNPFSRQIFIQCLAEENNVSGYFVNYHGQILAAFQFSSTSPFVFIHPGWPPGIYFLRLDFADKSVWQKVLISE